MDTVSVVSDVSTWGVGNYVAIGLAAVGLYLMLATFAPFASSWPLPWKKRTMGAKGR